MNILQEIKQTTHLTDRQIAERIAKHTGHTYHPTHISDVRNGHSPLSDKLRYRLLLAFPSFSDAITKTSANTLEVVE